MSEFFSWFLGLFKGLFKNVSVNPSTKEDYEAVLKSGATINVEWAKLLTAVREQLAQALLRIDALEKECTETRESLTAEIGKLNKEYIECESHRAEAAAEIANLKRQHAKNVVRIEDLENELKKK